MANTLSYSLVFDYLPPTRWEWDTNADGKMDEWDVSHQPTRVLTGDINGEGLADVIIAGHTTVAVGLSSGKRSDFLERIEDGLGGSIAAELIPAALTPGAISQLNICQAPTGATTCGNANTSPRQLTHRVLVSNGLGQTRSYRFAYNNDRYLPGRTSEQHDLGFADVSRTDEQTGIRITTWYSQEVPFEGRPIERNQFEGDGQRFHKQTFTYDVQSPGASSRCSFYSPSIVPD